MRQPPSIVRYGVVVAVAALALAACSSSGKPAPGTAVLGHTSDINPVPREQVRDGGNLRVTVSAFPSNWNTLSNDGNDNEVAEIEWPMMPRAFATDASGNSTVDHNYFTDVQLTGTEPQQVTYTINPKAVWSDGSPITWADIQSEAQALSGADKRFLIANNNGFDRVAKVERGVDDRQAVITFAKPFADWRGQLSGNAMLYPKSVTADPDSFNKSLADHLTLSAGPFVVQSTDRTQGRIVLARNPKWWGDTPKLDTVTYSILDRSAWVDALRNNEIDAAMLSSLSDVEQIQATPDVALRRAPGNRWRHLTFNGAPGSILSDEKARVAISKAIDRQNIADVTQNGLVDKPVPLNNHVFVQGQAGYRDNSLGYDPDEAARELDADGWVLQNGVRTKDGRKLEIRDVMYNDPVWVTIAKIIQQNLAKIGVTVTIDLEPGQNYFTDYIIPGDFDATQFSFVGDAFPLQSLNQIWGLRPDDEQSNFGRIGSPELNDLIERTVSELDPAAAIELANQVDRKIFEEGHSLPLTQNEGNWGVRKTVANYGSPGLASYDYTAIGFVK